MGIPMVKEIVKFFRLFSKVLLPLLGMSTIIDIFERLVNQKVRGEDDQPADKDLAQDKSSETPKMHTATEDLKEIIQAFQ